MREKITDLMREIEEELSVIATRSRERVALGDHERSRSRRHSYYVEARCLTAGGQAARDILLRLAEVITGHR